MAEGDFKIYLDKLEHYCAYQERCVADVKLKMNRLKVPTSLMEPLLKSLLEHQFIDEERYIRAFIQSKINIKRDGLEKIRYGLRQKGIHDQLIRKAFEEIDKSHYHVNLKSLIKKKWEALIVKNDKQETKTKIIRFLLSKGYKYEDFKNLINL